MGLNKPFIWADSDKNNKSFILLYIPPSEIKRTTKKMIF